MLKVCGVKNFKSASTDLLIVSTTILQAQWGILIGGNTDLLINTAYNSAIHHKIGDMKDLLFAAYAVTRIDTVLSIYKNGKVAIF